MKKILSFIILVTFLSSCLVGPKYDRPAMKVNTAYSGGDSTVVVQTVELDSVAVKDSIALIKWTEVYKDPELTIQPLLKINILGEVRTPGYYYVTDIENMTGILALAGGVTGSAATGDIYIIRGSDEILLDAYELMEANKTANDIGLRSGDRIFVPRSFWADAYQYGIILSGLAVLTTLLVVVLGN